MKTNAAISHRLECKRIIHGAVLSVSDCPISWPLIVLRPSIQSKTRGQSTSRQGQISALPTPSFASHPAASRGRAGRCDGRRLLRETVRALSARESRSCARAPTMPAEIEGIALQAPTLRPGRSPPSNRPGEGRRCCGMRGAAVHALKGNGRSAACAKWCRKPRCVAAETFPGVATRQTLARLWDGRAAVLAVFSGFKPFTTRGECNGTLLGHRSRSCARCWPSDGAAGECSTDSLRLVLTDAGGELLAASFCGQTGDTGIEPTSAAQLLAATSAQPPPCAQFLGADPPFSRHFRPHSARQEVD